MNGFKVIIKGKVQGVSYRAAAKKTATQLHLYGWVKNNDNGDVEMEIHGGDEKIESMLQWCNKGPVLAKVDKLEVENIPYNDCYKSFEIKYE